jgi:phage terminase large subunit-like protein
VLREQMLNGDWSVRERGMFQAAWLRYFRNTGGQLELFDAAGRMFSVLAPATMRRFATVDPAGTSADKAREQRGRAASWSVIQVWEQPWGEQSKYLLLRHQWRERVGFDGLVRAMRRIHAEWQPERIHIENEKLGMAAVDVLGGELPLETIATGGRDKAARAGMLITKFEAGEVFLPRDEAFVRLFEAELLAWAGHDHEPSDQIDAAVYAASIAHERQSGVVRLKM